MTDAEALNLPQEHAPSRHPGEQSKVRKKTRSRRLLEKKFADAYVANGFNAKQAYLKIRPRVKENTAAANGSTLIRTSADVRTRILEAMQQAGVNEENLANKIQELWTTTPDEKLGAWRIDRAIMHARAIMGLDAEKRSHLTVDKRSLVVTASITADQLATLLNSTRAPLAAPSNDPLPLIDTTVQEGDTPK